MMARMCMPVRVSQPGGGGSDIGSHSFSLRNFWECSVSILNGKLCSRVLGYSNKNTAPVFLEFTVRGGEFGNKQGTK